MQGAEKSKIKGIRQYHHQPLKVGPKVKQLNANISFFANVFW